MLDALLDGVISHLMTFGYTGIYYIMFLAGSILPIPWELVLLPLGATQYDPLYASLIAGLGASMGAGVGYYLGQIIGRPVLIRYGRYILIREEDMNKAEQWINRWGAPATLILRGIQYLPYKTYNFIAGISRMDFKTYMAFTIIGTTIRCTYMIYIGKMTNLTPDTLILIAIIIMLAGLVIPFARRKQKTPK